MADYIGRGLTFPIRLTNSGFVVISGGIELLNSSIKMILSSGRNQRFFLNEFYSGVDLAIGEPNDELLKGLVEHYILESLSKWEKRILISAIQVQRTTSDKLDITISYKDRKNNLQETLTFPFYKNLKY